MIKTTWKIDGMMCAMCESHINDTIREDYLRLEGLILPYEGDHGDHQ